MLARHWLSVFLQHAMHIGLVGNQTMIPGALQAETRGPQYNIFQTLFGVSVRDSNVSPPQDYTIAYQCYFL